MKCHKMAQIIREKSKEIFLEILSISKIELKKVVFDEMSQNDPNHKGKK